MSQEGNNGMYKVLTKMLTEDSADASVRTCLATSWLALSVTRRRCKGALLRANNEVRQMDSFSRRFLILWARVKTISTSIISLELTGATFGPVSWKRSRVRTAVSLLSGGGMCCFAVAAASEALSDWTSQRSAYSRNTRVATPKHTKTNFVFSRNGGVLDSIENENTLHYPIAHLTGGTTSGRPHDFDGNPTVRLHKLRDLANLAVLFSFFPFLSFSSGCLPVRALVACSRVACPAQISCSLALCSPLSDFSSASFSWPSHF